MVRDHTRIGDGVGKLIWRSTFGAGVNGASASDRLSRHLPARLGMMQLVDMYLRDRASSITSNEGQEPMRKAKVFGLCLALLAPALAIAAPKAFDQAKIEQLTGAKGKLDEKAGVFKVTMPRSDLKVTAAGVHITPPLGLTCWAAFTHEGNRTPRSWATSSSPRIRSTR